MQLLEMLIFYVSGSTIILKPFNTQVWNFININTCHRVTNTNNLIYLIILRLIVIHFRNTSPMILFKKICLTVCKLFKFLPSKLVKPFILFMKNKALHIMILNQITYIYSAMMLKTRITSLNSLISDIQRRIHLFLRRTHMISTTVKLNVSSHLNCSF